MNAGTDSTIQVCTFRLGDQLCGIDVTSIQEVLRSQAVTEVPLAPDEVTGLINLRGRIVTAIDLRRRLGLEPLEGSVRPMNVVLRQDEGEVSLLVDQIGDVVDVAVDGLESIPDTVDDRFREYLKGVYKLEDDLLLVLDAEKSSMALISGEADVSEEPGT